MKTKKEISAGPVLWGGRGKEEIVLLPSDVPYNRQVSGDGVGGNIQGSEECTAAPWPTELREIGIKGPCNPQPWTQVGGGGLGLAAQAGQRAGTVYKTEQPGTLLKKKKRTLLVRIVGTGTMRGEPQPLPPQARGTISSAFSREERRGSATVTIFAGAQLPEEVRLKLESVPQGSTTS